ncbi:hypothetical protein [Spectribacter hydrogenoxidans]|uniref:Uncharacterized protein n=1 Tax=Spectribacter hydrogenoxidans TaxID=3075608 RepID=A0ABU3C0J4_9GAMM|nr:hypothetical protein [Salinisphaera sp. W335]MDT0635086.1 hypothetical protein [Salinisphaera sp. W335]
MTRRTTAALAAALTLMAGAAAAQSAERIFQGVITSEGNACPSVTRMQAIGTIEGGDAMVAVACSNGDSHVVRIANDNQVSYIGSCGTLSAMTDAECFAR